MSYDKNLMIIANPGCGKTYKLLELSKECTAEGKRCLFLAFNKSIKKKVREKGILPENSVHTFHSLAYHDCKERGFLTRVFKDFSLPELNRFFEGDPDRMMDSMDGHNEKFTQAILDGMIAWWTKYAKNSIFKNYDYILVDEYQDLSQMMIMMLVMLMKINKHNNVRLFAAGDDRQDVYAHMHKREAGKNFKTFRELFGQPESIPLTICYRCSPTIQRFANGYITRQYDEKNLFDLTRYQPSDFSEDVYLHSIQNWKALEGKVERIVAHYTKSAPQKKILIVGRTHNELDNLTNTFRSNHNVTVSTIHGAKGDESDIVIICNIMFGDNLSKPEDQNLWNVAITRASFKLHIISSFPEKNVKALFQNNTYVFESEQSQLSEFDLPKLEETELDLTREKSSMSLCDSVEVRAKFEDIPFVPFEIQNIKKINKFQTDTHKELRGLEFVVTRLTGKYLKFSFHDLNRLKNEGMSDYKIIRFIQDVIKDYFNIQISEDELSRFTVTRLDLARFALVDHKKIRKHVRLLFRLAKYNDAVDRIGIKEGTSYLNGRRDIGSIVKRVLRIYDSDKKKINRITDTFPFTKIEFEYHRFDNTGYDGQVNLSFEQLLYLSETHQLGDIFKSWLEFEFPLLKKAPPRPDTLFKKYGIKGKKQITKCIKQGTADDRMKRYLFFAYINSVHILTECGLRQIFGLELNPRFITDGERIDAALDLKMEEIEQLIEKYHFNKD